MSGSRILFCGRVSAGAACWGPQVHAGAHRCMLGSAAACPGPQVQAGARRCMPGPAGACRGPQVHAEARRCRPEHADSTADTGRRWRGAILARRRPGSRALAAGRPPDLPEMGKDRGYRGARRRRDREAPSVSCYRIESVMLLSKPSTRRWLFGRRQIGAGEWAADGGAGRSCGCPRPARVEAPSLAGRLTSWRAPREAPSASIQPLGRAARRRCAPVERRPNAVSALASKRGRKRAVHSSTLVQGRPGCRGERTSACVIPQSIALRSPPCQPKWQRRAQPLG
jgi:hypothetical protein